jgi:hypothetical protein
MANPIGEGPPIYEEKGRTGENLGRPRQGQSTGLIAQSRNPKGMPRLWRSIHPTRDICEIAVHGRCKRRWSFVSARSTLRILN